MGSTLYLRASSNAGNTWGSPHNLFAGNDASVCATSKYIYVAYQDTSAASRVYLARADVVGVDDTPSFDVVHDLGEGKFPRVVCASRNVAVAWEESSSGGKQIGVAYSTRSARRGSVKSAVYYDSPSDYATLSSLALHQDSVSLFWRYGSASRGVLPYTVNHHTGSLKRRLCR